jgi:uncharacterized protein (TIGR02246 family)
MRSLFVVLAVVAVVLVGCGDDDDAESGDDSDAAAVIEAYEAAYNSGDLDAVVAVFSEDAVITGHPSGQGPATGLTEIESLHVRDMNSAAEADAYSFTNIETDGDTVTWDHVWTNGAGEDGCGEANSAVVTEDKIVTWTWAPTSSFPCEVEGS